MQKRRTTKQKDEIEYLDAKFLVRSKVSGFDLANLNKSSIFPKNTKKDRSYNNAVEHAKADLRLLNFFLRNLKPRYRLKILTSQEFQNIIVQIFDLRELGFSRLTKDEKDYALAMASQMLEFSLAVISKTMPVQFQNPLSKASVPFIDLLKAISDFARENKIKEIPAFQKDIIFYPQEHNLQ